MADEFVEVVNTTITSTELPNETTEYTLKTAGADESFAIKDIGIQHASSLAGYKFLLNDFESLSFGAGETGVASGLDLIPKSGTLKIKGTNVPVDSSSLVVTRGSGANVSSIITKSLVNEVSRADQTLFNTGTVVYSDTETFPASSSSSDSNNNMAITYWRNGTKNRKIRRSTKNTSELLRYADTEGASTTTISTYSYDYDIENEVIYQLTSPNGTLKSADATANISFSSTGAVSTVGSWGNSSEIHYLKGIVWAVENTSTVTPVMHAFVPSNNVVLQFNGSNRNGVGGNSSTTAMGFAFTYDPADDSFYYYISSYNTSNPHYISKHKCPKTLTEILAYSANTTITDAWTREWNEFTRSSTTEGPFAYNYTHHMRGSSTNPNIFYITDGSNCNDQIDLYSYNYPTNSLTLIDTMEREGNESSQHFIIERNTNTADETALGGALDEAKVRVTAIKTT